MCLPIWLHEIPQAIDHPGFLLNLAKRIVERDSVGRVRVISQ